MNAPLAAPANGLRLAVGRRERQFDYFPQGEICLVLRFTNAARNFLLETPLSSYQKIEQQPDGSTMVTGTVTFSERFRWWLRAFGPYVEVIEPAALRDEFVEEARAAYELYGL
ncbi:WYL domain-containing protein [Pandoraea terrae]|uniref:WYL domain-containing protein n=1 Tax=Pandoraea terrae TaxID=1537710 RepID=UPI00123F02E3